MNVKKICAYAVATFLILTVAFRLVAGEGFESGTVTSQMVREKAVTPEILTNTVLEQVFVSECDRITELTLLGTNYGKNVDDELRLTVLDGDGQTVASGRPAGQLPVEHPCRKLHRRPPGRDADPASDLCRRKYWKRCVPVLRRHRQRWKV